MAKFSTRWIVKIGGYLRPEQYIADLYDDGIEIRSVIHVVRKVSVENQEQVIELTIGSMKELGLLRGGTIKKRNAAIIKAGGKLCPAEVALALRKMIKSHTECGWLAIAMASIKDTERGEDVAFTLANEGETLYLLTQESGEQTFCEPDACYVFVTPQQSSISKAA